jgi:xanthine phosphoribosyltransferase
MDLLKQRIVSEGKVIGQDILKVDSFLNHQIDVQLFNEMGKEFHKCFANDGVTKILTIEASGIGIACITAQYFNVPVVFAKKMDSRNLGKDTYESEVYSYTKGKGYKIRVSKKYILPGEKVLVIDDFLANGNAVLGLKEIVATAGAELIGAGIVIEKGFQNGGKLLRGKGIKVCSLAVIKSMEDGKICFE